MHTITKIAKWVVTMFLIPVFFFAQCNKEPKPCSSGSGYVFLATAEWSPQQEIYQIGDTLFLSATIPKALTDQINTSMVINYSNSVGIEGNLTLFEMDSISHEVIDGASNFEVSAIAGVVSSHPSKPRQIKVYILSENASSYSLRLQLITKQKGLFALFLSNLYSQGINGKNCTNASFSNTLTNSNKNINLFEYAMGRPPASQYEIDRIYCFRVN